MATSRTRSLRSHFQERTKTRLPGCRLLQTLCVLLCRDDDGGDSLFESVNWVLSVSAAAIQSLHRRTTNERPLWVRIYCGHRKLFLKVALLWTQPTGSDAIEYYQEAAAIKQSLVLVDFNYPPLNSGPNGRNAVLFYGGGGGGPLNCHESY